jgi:hypothetical protein
LTLRYIGSLGRQRGLVELLVVVVASGGEAIGAAREHHDGAKQEEKDHTAHSKTQ